MHEEHWEHHQREGLDQALANHPALVIEHKKNDSINQKMEMLTQNISSSDKKYCRFNCYKQAAGRWGTKCTWQTCYTSTQLLI